MKQVFRITTTILTILVLGILPFVVFTLITSKTDAIAGTRSFVVLSGSMQPKISVGSILFTKKKDSYRTGDVVAFTNKVNQTVTHRIIEVVEKDDGIFFKTQGDANNTPDNDLITQSDIIGVGVFSLPYVGSFASYLKTTKGFLILIILPAVILIAVELWNIKKELEKQVERRILDGMNKI